MEPVRLPGTVVTARLSGRAVRFFVNNAADDIQFVHNQGNWYEPDELAIIARFFQPGGTFVDCGANVGNHSLYAALVLGARRVIPFEAHPMAAEILRLNVALNACADVVDTRYLGRGVGSREGPLALHGEMASNLGATAFGHDPAGKYRVIRVDAVLAGEPIDFIKLDVEGMELDVLAGLEETVTRWRPGLFAEIEDDSQPHFQAWCMAHGYVVVDRFERYRTKPNYMAIPLERA